MIMNDSYFTKRVIVFALICLFTILNISFVQGKGDFVDAVNLKNLPDKEVSGLVTDSSGSPLPGVTIFVKNDKSIGTTTDVNGRYILSVPDDAVVVFSMVGFDQQE